MTKHFNKKVEKPKRRYLRSKATPAEKLVWIYLRKKQVKGFRFLRQYSVDSYVIDFFCTELKLAIEIDGESHFVDKNAIEYDKKREKHIKQFGIVFLRFNNMEIYQNLDKVFEKIEEKVEELINLRHE
ncbi:endonuclease domain-containing protein [bacterium]|nr:endonuclease domain-containing protein [bacterium]